MKLIITPVSEGTPQASKTLPTTSLDDFIELYTYLTDTHIDAYGLVKRSCQPTYDLLQAGEAVSLFVGKPDFYYRLHMIQ